MTNFLVSYLKLFEFLPNINTFFKQMVPIQVAGGPTIRAFPKMNPNREQQLKMQGPAVTVFVGRFIHLFNYYNYL